MSNNPFAVDPDNRATIPAAKRKAGFLPTQEPHEYANQAIFESVTNHVWGTQAQALTDDVTFYTDGSGNPLDKDAVAVTINEDDKILIGHNATATANLLLDAGGKKITIEMMAGVTLAMSTFDLTLGGSGDSVGGDIRLTQTGSLTINGNRGLKINNSRDVYEDFKTKNLVVNVQSVTTVGVWADNIIFVDRFGGGKRVDNITASLSLASDIVGGRPIKPSIFYQIHLDSEGNQKLAPDVEGIADGTTSGFLVDSTNELASDLYKAGDIVFNLDTKEQTTILTTPTVDNADLALVDDIMSSGENYKIRMMSPTGIGEFAARLGNAPTDSGSEFDDRFAYTQDQKKRIYYGDGTDFTITNIGGGGAFVYTRPTTMTIDNFEGTILAHLRIVMISNPGFNNNVLGFDENINFYVDQGFTLSKGATAVASVPLAGLVETSTRLTFDAAGVSQQVTIDATFELMNLPDFYIS